MSATKRNVLVGVLIALSIGGFISAAICFAQLAHIGANVVGSGGPGPNANAWIVTALSVVMAFVPASWAKYLLMAQQAIPVITDTIGTIRGATPITDVLTDVKAIPLPGPFAPLQELLNSIDVSTPGEVKSTGEHPIAGGKVVWSITFTPAIKVAN